MNEGPGDMADLRVLVVADDPLARAGLASLLGEQPGLTIVGRASSLDDLAAAVEVYRPDLLLWDLGWNPVASLERLAGSAARLPVAALVSEESHAPGAWSAGARALLRRDADPVQIATALVALACRLTVVDPAFTAVLAQPMEPAPPAAWDDRSPAPLIEPLTPRELEVLRLMAEGLPNKAIAGRLQVSEHTVKFHVNAILGKLGVASRTEAVVRATRLGLVLL